MPYYRYYAEVSMFSDGEVKAKNKKEALKKAEEEINCDGLLLGEIEIDRISKEDSYLG